MIRKRPLNFQLLLVFYRFSFLLSFSYFPIDDSEEKLCDITILSSIGGINIVFTCYASSFLFGKKMCRNVTFDAFNISIQEKFPNDMRRCVRVLRAFPRSIAWHN